MADSAKSMSSKESPKQHWRKSKGPKSITAGSSNTSSTSTGTGSRTSRKRVGEVENAKSRNETENINRRNETEQVKSRKDSEPVKGRKNSEHVKSRKDSEHVKSRKGTSIQIVPAHIVAEAQRKATIARQASHDSLGRAYGTPYEPARIINPCICCICCGGCCNLRANCLLIAILFAISGLKNFFQVRFMLYHLSDACQNNTNISEAQPVARCDDLLNLYTAAMSCWTLAIFVSTFVSGLIFTSLYLPPPFQNHRELAARVAAFTILFGVLLTILRYILIIKIAASFQELVYSYAFENPVLKKFYGTLGQEKPQVHMEGEEGKADSFVHSLIIPPLCISLFWVTVLQLYFAACVYQYRKQIIAGVAKEPTKSQCRKRRPIGLDPPAFGQQD